MYLKELLQKPILSLYDGEILGNVSKVYFCKQNNKIKFFEIINSEDIAYYIQPKNIYSFGKHAITIKNKQNLELNFNQINDCILPIDVKVFSLQGEYIGLVADYVINEKYIIESLILDSQQLINIKYLASCSKTSIVVYDSDEHVNINSFRYRIKNKPINTTKVKILPKLFTQFNKISQVNNAKNNFMVGRICAQDIFDNNKNLIVKQNSTITEHILALATSKNKLNDLIKFSKPK